MTDLDVVRIACFVLSFCVAALAWLSIVSQRRHQKLSESTAALGMATERRLVEYQEYVASLHRSVLAQNASLRDHNRYVQELARLCLSNERELTKLGKAAPASLSARVALLELRVLPDQTDCALSDWADAIEGEITVAGGTGGKDC